MADGRVMGNSQAAAIIRSISMVECDALMGYKVELGLAGTTLEVKSHEPRRRTNHLGGQEKGQ